MIGEYDGTSTGSARSSYQLYHIHRDRTNIITRCMRGIIRSNETCWPLAYLMPIRLNEYALLVLEDAQYRCLARGNYNVGHLTDLRHTAY
jgi:hypothetical protein